MSGQKVSGSARLSLKEMFPQATEEQLKALNEGRPVPPSQEWLAENNVSAKPTVNVEEEMPLVSCVLVFGDARRTRIARKAVNQFVAQTYERKQLVIVNATDQAVTNVPYAAIKEVRIEERNPSIGFMRSKGIALADGSWIKQWDDDDVYDPLLLAYQMGCRRPGHATLLTHQVRCNINRAIACLHTQPEGIAGTILFPKQAGLQYPDISLGEDRAFWISHFATKTHLIDNHSFPTTIMQIAVFHGRNATPESVFMRDHADPTMNGRVELPEAEADYMRKRLSEFGLEIKPQTAGL